LSGTGFGDQPIDDVLMAQRRRNGGSPARVAANAPGQSAQLAAEPGSPPMHLGMQAVENGDGVARAGEPSRQVTADEPGAAHQ
jgi:hypothetical protein